MPHVLLLSRITRPAGAGLPAAPGRARAPRSGELLRRPKRRLPYRSQRDPALLREIAAAGHHHRRAGSGVWRWRMGQLSGNDGGPTVTIIRPPFRSRVTFQPGSPPPDSNNRAQTPPRRQQLRLGFASPEPGPAPPGLVLTSARAKVGVHFCARPYNMRLIIYKRPTPWN